MNVLRAARCAGQCDEASFQVISKLSMTNGDRAQFYCKKYQTDGAATGKHHRPN